MLQGTRRGFLVFLAAPAVLTIGCRRAPAPVSARRSDAIQPVPSGEERGVTADIRAVREYALPLEAPPSFVFSTGFRNVP